MLSIKLRSSLYFLLFSFLILIDRVTKFLALSNFTNKQVSCLGCFNFIIVWNKGVCWGLFSSTSFWGFLSLVFVISIVLILFSVYTVKEFLRKENVFFEVMILAGAFSNFIDRILYRAVIDFIDFSIASWHWPAFNLADSFIVIGVLGIIGRYLYNAYSGEIKRT